MYGSVMHSYSVTPTAYLVKPAYKSIDGGVAPSEVSVLNNSKQ